MAATDERDKDDLEAMRNDLTERPPMGSRELRLYLLRMIEMMGRIIERADEQERSIAALKEGQ